MKLLFIQGGSRWKFDQEGNVYTDANFNEKIWDRYRLICDELTVLLRCETKTYEKTEAEKMFNKYDMSKSHCVSMPDLYRPVKNVFKLSVRKEIKEIIKNEVIKADKVIIRSVSDIYTDLAVKYAKKYKKSYLIEVTTFIFESLWYHSLKGKLVAYIQEQKCKKVVSECEYASYVTDDALQNRYPCKKYSLGCSDVELPVISKEVLDKRIEKISKKDNSKKMIIGTAAFLDVGWKGQKYVIKALYNLKKRGMTNLEYQLIGSGTGDKLKKIVEKLNMQDQVKIIGALEHEKVFEWLDTIDVYVQPSFQEGLCRALLEAMSRACPAIASDVGGNYELLEKACLFQKGNVGQIVDQLENMCNLDSIKRNAQQNYDKALKYSTNILNQKRTEFYKKFAMEERVK